MTMDGRVRGFSGSTNGIQLRNQFLPVLPNQNLVPGPRFGNTYLKHNFMEFYYPRPDPTPNHVSLVSTVSQEEDSPEDCDFSDVVLKYINNMLMEEDMEDKTCMLQDSLDLQAAEKSFYDVLGQKYPPSPETNLTYLGENGECLEDDLSGNYSHCISSSSNNSDSCLLDTTWAQDHPEHSNTSLAQSFTVYNTSQSSYSSSNSAIDTVDGLVDSVYSTSQLRKFCSEIQSAWQFGKGVEEASKLLPSGNELFVNMEVNGWLRHEQEAGTNWATVKAENKDEVECFPSGSRGRKNPHRDDDDDLEEERSSKQAAVFAESVVRSDMFDMVLLCNGQESTSAILRDTLQKGANRKVQQNGQSKGPNGGKGRDKKRAVKKEVVDLRTLLIHCAQAVAADDRRSANELLKQIRQHSSPFGDGNQRLAHCFADGLEARLAGTGSQIYKSLVSKRTSAADILKAYHLYLAACPFRKLSNFVSNKTIMNVAGDCETLHVIDFGILYGFQWPTLIQRLANRPGGPPKLRITGIDFPQPGFRPAERVEETGRRLANYAESFEVPFEFNAIAKKWETIQVEELKINPDEVVAVNCLYRAKNLLDETVTVDSPRNVVIDLIKNINPKIFVHGIVNGSYNAPFFVTRFREGLFHFSAQFDMLETIVPREDQERILIEREIFGREALNVIACEGWERVERPETYKQWQVRHLRAGFVQLPIDWDIVRRATNRVKLSYHKDFVIDEDSRWLLQGWKGRTVYALSTWKPV